MTVPVVFEGGILQNDELFSFLEEVKSKVPDIVNSKDDKTFLINYKKEISATINEIDLSEKKQIDEMIQIFRDRNPRVWEARSELAGIVKKITQLNSDYDERRRKAGFEAVEFAVNQANVVYGLSGTRFVLTTGRFTSVDALTAKGDLKKSIQDKIDSAGLQAQANLEQERLLEAARIAERDKQQELAKKEQELKHREQVLEKRETGDTQALSQQLEEERIKNKALENQNANIANTGESKIEGIIERIETLEMKIEPNKNYSGKSVLNVLNKIKELLHG
ncbi:hypothetical protein [Lactococcus lactis]|uniref:Phage protein n=2 Tax=Lactococcus lactis TaxID=1358 RepID=A0ABC8A6Y3_LACLL|nr:hypothetical protein [Lactococcus lactis]AII13145.1 Hypothetical protein NCDO2118_1686 [Lactococcus lactis subsp. lactis NCDO 2118]ATY87927.1 hypothetical protein CV702_07055 [Lactococcus lactis subsp. lactis]ATZ01482.1 hypothetical protein CV098_06660 [Lactococcus lactis subsp. lactis]QOK49299.1 hypothetical protein HZ322_06630 [Lactococcus lactis]